MAGTARILAIASGTCSTGTPNLDALPPVARAAWVFDSTPGLTRSSTGVGLLASRSILSMSSKPSTTM